MECIIANTAIQSACAAFYVSAGHKVTQEGLAALPWLWWLIKLAAAALAVKDMYFPVGVNYRCPHLFDPFVSIHTCTV